MKLNINDIPLDDKKTWDLISQGNCYGVFQMESYLGRHWCKTIKPASIEELAAVAALLRPGCLHKSGDPPKSMTQRYADRKHGKEVSESYHPALDSILKSTYHVLVFQESAMAIAQKIAGFDLNDADRLRKSIGDKDAELMSQLESEFVDGCKKTGLVNEKQAKEIFGWIRASQRYSFNKSITLDTTVITSEGVEKTVEDVDIGEFIECPDGLCKVLDKHDHGTQEVYEVILESDKKIECTMNHKFMCENGEILPLWQIIKDNHKIICQTKHNLLFNLEKIS